MDLSMLGKHFFALLPNREFNWERAVTCWSEVDEAMQGAMLDVTVRSPLCRAFSPHAQHCRAFLKYIIAQLELSGVSVSDEVYEEYGAQLMKPMEAPAGVQLSNKSYFMPDGSILCLEESLSLVSHGTTGLRTWQAAQYLAEWASENSYKLNNKHILELGSGLGFTGLAVQRTCQPKSYTFSDHHQEVLEALAANVHRNLTSVSDTALDSDGQKSSARSSQEECNEQPWQRVPTAGGSCESEQPRGFCERCWRRLLATETTAYWRHHHHPAISIARIDWEKCGECDLRQMLQELDVILAADVVYDLSILPALVRVLHTLLTPRFTHSTHRPVAYVASTVRRQETQQLFQEALREAGLQVTVMQPVETQWFCYDRTGPIQIIQLTAIDPS